MTEIGRQIRDLEQLAAYLRAEMRQAERDRIRIPNELTEKITMLRRTADAVENHIKCVQVLRRPKRASRSSTMSFPFSEGQRSISFGAPGGSRAKPQNWRP